MNPSSSMALPQTPLSPPKCPQASSSYALPKTSAQPRFTWKHTFIFALGGPAIIGALLGLEIGPLSALAKALLLPAVLLGVAAVMIPALYIGATLTGVAPPANAMAKSLGRGFRACGLVMLGLAGPVLFLLATTHSEVITSMLGICTTLAGVGAGLRILFADLFEHRSFKSNLAFAVWALVALGIGLHLYIQFVAH